MEAAERRSRSDGMLSRRVRTSPLGNLIIVGVRSRRASIEVVAGIGMQGDVPSRHKGASHAMTHFVEVSRLERIAPGRATVVAGEHGAIALFNAEGRIFAVDDTCVRCGSSLAAGTLTGTQICCPGCDWRYDVETGCVNGIPALKIDTFAVRVVDSRVMVSTTLNWIPHG